MTQTATISPARKAMLELIKSKKQSSSTSSSSSTSNGSDDETNKNKNKKKKLQPNHYNKQYIKKELDEKRRSAYIVRLGGKMI